MINEVWLTAVRCLIHYQSLWPIWCSAGCVQTTTTTAATASTIYIINKCTRLQHNTTHYDYRHYHYRGIRRDTHIIDASTRSAHVAARICVWWVHIRSDKRDAACGGGRDSETLAGYILCASYIVGTYYYYCL